MSVNALRRKLGRTIASLKLRLRHVEGALKGQRERLPDGTQHYMLPHRHVFFGYYDVSPFAEDGRLLAMSAPALNRGPEPEDEIEIGYFERNADGRFHKIGTTTAWSWQQGCRLRWFPRHEHGRNNLVIYNVARADGFGSVVRDVASGKETARFEHALYDIASDGRYGLSLDFHRLGIYRAGYGYASVRHDPTLQDPAPVTSAITRVDLSSGRAEKLISLADIAALEPRPSMDGAAHYFNHISIAPRGDRFLFYHFWSRGSKKHSRGFIANADGTNLLALDLGSNASHYAWIDDATLLVYCQPEGSAMRYWIFNIQTGERTAIEDSMMMRDGHPSTLADGRFILTDTYPDAYSFQRVIMHDRYTSSTRLLARLYSPPRFRGDVRCDLHPRLSPDEKWICVDSARSGLRALYVFPIVEIASA